MHKDAMYMELALQEAELSGADVPVGCIIIQEDNVIARGHNQRERNLDPTAHAEIVAIRQAAQALQNWRLERTTLYCTLEPCPMCAEAIIQSRVGKVVFGAYDAIAGAAGSAFNLFVPGRALPIPEIVGGILEDRCREALLVFFQEKRTRGNRC